MDGKRTFQNILLLFLFIAITEGSIICAVTRPKWDSRDILLGLVELIGIASAGMTVLVFRELKSTLVPKPPKPKKIMEGPGRLLQYKGKEK